MRFPEAMRAIMRTRGATQQSLAEAVGVSQPAIGNMARRGNPSLDVCSRYMAELGYEVALVPMGSRLPEGCYVLEPMRGE